MVWNEKFSFVFESLCAAMLLGKSALASEWERFTHTRWVWSSWTWHRIRNHKINDLRIGKIQQYPNNPLLNKEGRSVDDPEIGCLIKLRSQKIYIYIYIKVILTTGKVERYGWTIKLCFFNMYFCSVSQWLRFL